MSSLEIPTILPKHIAIIMDGNGRWARARNLSNSEGHKAGLDPLRSVIQCCGELRIQALTVFAFSSENWKRPDQEVNALMTLFLESLIKEIDELNHKQVQLRIIGSREKFSHTLQKQMLDCELLTKTNTGLVFSIAVDYGGRWDITEAAKQLAQACVARKMTPEQITEQSLAACISNSDLPDPDLCIRTGGDNRISNFLLWQFAYTELLVNECLWPDYGREKFIADLQCFAERERRFGQSG